jgi:long-chain acyl-CoA synthetase
VNPGQNKTEGQPSIDDRGLDNVCQMLENSADRFPGNPVIIFGDRVIRYRELREKVHQMAAALQALGVGKGDRVAIMLPNCPELIITFYAALTIGAIVVMGNPRYTVREMEERLEKADAGVLVLPDLFWPKAAEIKAHGMAKTIILTPVSFLFSGIQKTIYPLLRRFKGKINFKHKQEAYFFDKLLEEFASQPIPGGIKNYSGPHEPAALQFTGGTTGKPQGAVLTHFNLVRNAVQVARWFPELDIGGERMLAVLPFYHIFALTVCMNLTILAGGAIVMAPRFRGRNIENLLEVIHRRKPTLFPAVPALYAAINNCKNTPKYDLESIKFCISGADKLPGPIQERFQELTGAVLVEGYGLTEASPVTHCNPLEKGKNRLGSIGVPVSETSARIVDIETGEDLPPGELGELAVRGPQVMQGYWKDKEETGRALRDGWLFTGDLAKRDEDGYYYIMDRLKELIIVGGFNVYPREVEDVLYKHPKIAEAAVIGEPDPHKGERVKAVVVPKPGMQVSAEEIRNYCRKYLTGYKVPKYVEFRDELPKSAVGKILKKELKR